MADHACLLFDELAVLEDGEVGDAAHVVTRGEFGVRVGVYLEDDGVAGEVGGGAGYLGGGGSAGSAPVGPEVYENRDAGALDYLVEESRCRRGQAR